MLVFSGILFGIVVVLLFFKFCAEPLEQELSIKFTRDWPYWGLVVCLTHWFTPVCIALVVLYYGIIEDTKK